MTSEEEDVIYPRDLDECINQISASDIKDHYLIKFLLKFYEEEKKSVVEDQAAVLLGILEEMSSKLNVFDVVRKGNLELLKYYLDQKGVNINIKCESTTEYDLEGNTLLHHAIYYGQHPICKYLIKHGADINSIGYGNETPLLVAVRSHDIEIAKILIQAGADVKVRDSLNDTLLHVAIKTLNKEIVFNANCFNQLISNSEDELINLLIEKGVDINAEGFYGLTVLQAAKDKYNSSLLEDYLKNKGAKITSDSKLHYGLGGGPARLITSHNEEEYLNITKLHMRREFETTIKKEYMKDIYNLLDCCLTINSDKVVNYPPADTARETILREFDTCLYETNISSYI